MSLIIKRFAHAHKDTLVHHMSSAALHETKLFQDHDRNVKAIRIAAMTKHASISDV